MNRMLSVTAALAAAGALLVNSADNAEAAFAMRLTQGATVINVADGSGIDLAPDSGIIVFLGNVGAFQINVDTGQSDPVLAPPLPHMDLSVVATTTVDPVPDATLVVELSQTGFTSAGLQRFATQWSPGVGANATSEFDVFIDLADNLFGTDDLLAANETNVADLGPALPGASGYNVTGSAPTDSSYSVTLRWIITHTGLATTTGNAELQIPEPGSLALFGLGLLGLGFLARRRTALR